MQPTARPKHHLMTRFLETMSGRVPKIGDIVTGVVIAKEAKRVFIDLGPLGTGIIYGAEYLASRDEIKNLAAGAQANLKLLSLANEEGFFEVSLKEAGRQEAWEALRRLKEEREIIQTKVLDANRGGLILALNQVTGFLPVSQLSIEHYPRVEGGEKNRILEELKKFVGQELKVRILDLNPKEQKLIFSEREAEEDELKNLISQYKIGDAVDGEITAVVPFGAFLKFGRPPLEGLIHISEIDWRLIDDPNKYLKVGDTVQARIIGIENNRVSLSLKALKEDPWSKVLERYHKNEIYPGRVIKVNPFGAFIELDPDIHGLLHVSQAGGLAKLKEKFEVGNTYSFQVLSIDPQERRLSLGLAESLEELPPVEAQDSPE